MSSDNEKPMTPVAMYARLRSCLMAEILRIEQQLAELRQADNPRRWHQLHHQQRLLEDKYHRADRGYEMSLREKGRTHDATAH